MRIAEEVAWSGNILREAGIAPSLSLNPRQTQVYV